MSTPREFGYAEDGGPIYFESNFEAIIVEPFNMISAALFIFLAAYWIYKSYAGGILSHFVFYSSILLMIGGIGGTIYHGFRVSQFALFMDWVPILILCLAAAGYFIKKTTGKWKWVVIGFGVFIVLEVCNILFTPDRFYNNVSYSIMALMVLIPTFLVLNKTDFRNWKLIVLAFGSFTLALIFRIYDRDGWLDIGTHFLWHVLGAFATHFMFQFVYSLDLENQSLSQGFRFPKKAETSHT